MYTFTSEISQPSQHTQHDNIHADIASHTGSPHRAEPTHPLEAVDLNQPCPVDTDVSYMKPRDMNLEQAYQARLYYLWKQSIDPAIHVLERILILEEDQNQRAYHMIEIGDLHMSKEDYAGAQTVYETCIEQYPGSAYFEYLMRQLMLCHYYNMMPPEKDQTETRNVITSADTYLNTFGEFSTYAHEAHQLQRHAYHDFCTAELLVSDFYLNKYTYTQAPSTLRAAYYRLQYMYDHIVPYLDAQQSHNIGGIIARALHNIAINKLENATHEDTYAIYCQLYDTCKELHNALEGKNENEQRRKHHPHRRF